MISFTLVNLSAKRFLKTLSDVISRWLTSKLLTRDNLLTPQRVLSSFSTGVSENYDTEARHSRCRPRIDQHSWGENLNSAVKLSHESNCVGRPDGWVIYRRTHPHWARRSTFICAAMGRRPLLFPLSFNVWRAPAKTFLHTAHTQTSRPRDLFHSGIFSFFGSVFQTAVCITIAPLRMPFMPGNKRGPCATLSRMRQRRERFSVTGGRVLWKSGRNYYLPSRALRE